ncbi:MAG TPA: RNase adapter RapZ [Nitrospiria bacterium]|nr:RNase adapter RapZ [Nitrospiria bacterium]
MDRPRAVAESEPAGPPRSEPSRGPRIVIVTGLSGAGKSHVLHCFEDVGFFCVDNLPPPLIPTFVHLYTRGEPTNYRIALGIDIRGREFLSQSFTAIEQLRQSGFCVEMLFLDARDDVLIRRFSETRRPHPLAHARPVSEGIVQEREELRELRDRADLIIDTSDYSVHQLKAVIAQRYVERRHGLAVTVISFGYKFGVPREADLVFDVRFLKNPNFVEALRPLSGQDSAVSAYVVNLPETAGFLARLEDLLDFLLPLYESEGRTYLTIGIGCTGGRHRSVAVAEQLAGLLAQRGLHPTVQHRDIDRQIAG